MSNLVYLDSSAIVKLVVDEAESEALRETAAAWRGRLSSALARVEVARTLRGLGLEPGRERSAIRSVSLITLTDAVLDAASVRGPPGLRSLDAIHLASALRIGEGLDAFVTYDKRLSAAAEASGLRVLAPR